MIELFDVVAIEPGAALAAKLCGRIDRRVWCGKSQIKEERMFLGLLRKKLFRLVREDEINAIIRSRSLCLRTADGFAPAPKLGRHVHADGIRRIVSYDVMVLHKDVRRLVVRARRAEERIETNFERTRLEFGIPIQAWFAAKAVVPFPQRRRAIASGLEH